MRFETHKIWQQEDGHYWIRLITDVHDHHQLQVHTEEADYLPLKVLDQLLNDLHEVREMMSEEPYQPPPMQELFTDLDLARLAAEELSDLVEASIAEQAESEPANEIQAEVRRLLIQGNILLALQEAKIDAPYSNIYLVKRDAPDITLEPGDFTSFVCIAESSEQAASTHPTGCHIHTVENNGNWVTDTNNVSVIFLGFATWGREEFQAGQAQVVLARRMFP